MSMFPPSTASRLAVIPHSVIRNKIADSAMPFTTMVITDKPDSNNIPILLPVFLDISAMEKMIIAITPMSSKLKIIRKFPVVVWVFTGIDYGRKIQYQRNQHERCKYFCYNGRNLIDQLRIGIYQISCEIGAAARPETTMYSP
jgi:hypothetical protein